ncbi:MAG: hypothetical protein U5K33_04845 [Halofilum sp. (in: g-proteobacteria)]|nr:hypothetical protein [Halofilum sp. (in: g-proteobacteria)]
MNTVLQSLSARPGTVAILLVLLVAALYLPWLGYTDLMHEETRRAVIARTMMESGDYLVPMLGERIYLNKPPLFNWMIVATSLPVGTVTEWTARLATFASLALLAATMVLTAGHRLGTPARWLLGIGTVVTGEVMHKAVLANVDIDLHVLRQRQPVDLVRAGRPRPARAGAVAAAGRAGRRRLPDQARAGPGVLLLRHRRLPADPAALRRAVPAAAPDRCRGYRSR